MTGWLKSWRQVVGVALMGVSAAGAAACVDRGGLDQKHLASLGDGSTCVWATGDREQATDRVLKGWTQRHGLGPLRAWDAGIRPKVAQVTLHLGGGQRTLLLRLGDDCAKPPVVSELSPPGKAPLSPAVLRELGRAFPAPKRQIQGRGRPHGFSGAGTPGQAARRATRQATRPGPSGPLPQGSTASEKDREASATHQQTFLILGLLLVLGAWLTDRSSPRVRQIFMGAVLLTIAGLAGVAAAPLFHVPFTHDAQWLRVGYARESVFGDWNHPFLPYLLNRPATWFSLEPWALRVIPFGWVVATCSLLVVAARRRGGNLAGALAGLWFACEVRRRHGLNELADWDLAAAMLLGLVVWMQWDEDNGTTTRWRTGILVVLLVAALFSSWLMIVPITVAVGVLWLRPGERWRRAGLTTVVWLGLSGLALNVFRKGSPSDPDVAPFGELLREMLNETPAFRAAWMLPLLFAGLVWLAWGWRKQSHRFVGGALIAIPLAVLVAWRWSQVHGGYYVSLTTPLLLFAAAVAVSRGATWSRDWLAGRWGHRLGAAVVAAALSGGVYLTVILPPLPGAVRLRGGGIQHLGAFERKARQNQRPIVTNFYHLPLALSYERARRGGAVPGGILRRGGPPDFAPRIRQMDPHCHPKSGWPPAGARFYLVFGHIHGRWPRCASKLPVSCKPLYKESFLLNFYDCRKRP